MPLGALLIGLTLLQDPDGFRICKNSCPIPTHKTLREIIPDIPVPPSFNGGSSALQLAPASTSSVNSSVPTPQSNAEFGEMIKKVLLETISAKEAKAAKAEPLKTLTIYFPFNSSQISEADEKRLFDFIAERGDLAMGDPDGERFMKLYVTGFTDSKGSKTYNQKLALKRARAVESVLKKREYNNVIVEAKGKCCYTESNTEDAKNRRVEVKTEHDP